MPPAATSLAYDEAAAAERALLDYLAADRAKPLLRFITCGSVDDGKSTLIGRLLFDAKRLFQDQLATLEADSRRFGTQGQGLDFALLVDGLSAEREQGITIDVAYRFFNSERRKFIVADAPGHEQYTRNMATAASTADLAILLIDATQGVLAQTRRHARIARLMGVRSLVVAVNKMDLAGHDRAAFDTIAADFAAFAAAEGIGDFTAIPMVATQGENVTRRAASLPWYDGPTLIEALEAAPVGEQEARGGFALPVQWVNRPDAGFRGFSGTIARGAVRTGDRVTVLPGGQVSRIARIVTFDGDLTEAGAGQAVTVVLADQVECAAGAVIASADAPLTTGDAIHADLIWFDETPLAIGRRYLLQTGARAVPARVAALDGAPEDGPALAMNGIAVARIVADAPVAAAAYADSRALGAFVLIDRESHATVAAGMIRTLDTDATRPAVRAAPIYAFGPDRDGAERAVGRLRAGGGVAALLDVATLRAGVAADLPEDAPAALWRRATAVADLMAGAGVTVALAIVPPPGTDPHGIEWTGESESDWVI